MAELKEYEAYDYDLDDSTEIAQQVTPEPVLTYPKKKLRHVSTVEKIIVSLIIVTFVAVAFMTVKLTTTISRAEEEISTMAQDIDAKEDLASKLEQEKSELSRAERVKEAAVKAGLEVNDENIRIVKK